MARSLLLNKEEKKKIEKRIEELEKKTSGEVVVYVARKSDTYTKSIWYMATIQALLVSIGIVLLSYQWMLPEGFGPVSTSLTIIISLAAGAFIPSVFMRVRIYLTRNVEIMDRLLTRAHDVFLQQSLFNTKNRIGILFYVSALERQVVVLADAGINAKIEQDQLNEILGDITKGIKSKNFAHGVVQAIDRCENLLLEHGFNHAPDDKNELANHVINEFETN